MLPRRGGTVDPEEIRTAEADGKLYLFAEDGGAGDNTGRIRVWIVVNPSSTEQ